MMMRISPTPRHTRSALRAHAALTIREHCPARKSCACRPRAAGTRHLDTSCRSPTTLVLRKGATPQCGEHKSTQCSIYHGDTALFASMAASMPSAQLLSSPKRWPQTVALEKEYHDRSPLGWRGKDLPYPPSP